MEAQSGDILGKAAHGVERDLVRVATDVLALGQDAVGHRNDLATASFRLVDIDKLTRGRPQDLAVGLGGGLLHRLRHKRNGIDAGVRECVKNQKYDKYDYLWQGTDLRLLVILNYFSENIRQEEIGRAHV